LINRLQHMPGQIWVRKSDTGKAGIGAFFIGAEIPALLILAQGKGAVGIKRHLIGRCGGTPKGRQQTLGRRAKGRSILARGASAEGPEQGIGPGFEGLFIACRGIEIILQVFQPLGGVGQCARRRLRHRDGMADFIEAGFWRGYGTLGGL
jgi:hypothetical protein